MVSSWLFDRFRRTRDTMVHKQTPHAHLASVSGQGQGHASKTDRSPTVRLHASTVAYTRDGSNPAVASAFPPFVNGVGH